MSKRFKEVKQLDYVKTELDILQWWNKNNIFEKSLTTREDGIPFTFYEGPPTANGKPGIHHVMARTVKDLFCRYKTLKGHKVDRKGGWDTHGLPVEIEVEKELELQGRSEVEAYGVAKYNKHCRESVLKYKDLWDTLTKRIGYWVDLDDPYITFDNKYIESVWWALSELYKKGLIYKGYKIQWYSPGSGTVLSSHEVSLGYQEIQDPSVFIKFKADDQEDTYYLAWTTTPWTLISNMALAVNRDIEYITAKLVFEDKEQKFILAKGLADKVLSGYDYEITDTFKGSDLIGKTYTPLFDYALKDYDKSEAWRIIEGDFVTLEDGTGVVHTAPAFGADDYDVCMKENIPMFNPIDREGRFESHIEEFAGQWFKDADKNISRNLKERGIMFKHLTYLHNYPHDWRKGTPLMSYPVESWFIKTTAVKDKMVAFNKEINWKPASTGTKRFGAWLENNVDWAISRQRYWGTPLPIWINDENHEEIECIGSIDELKAKAGLSDQDELDMHRPYIDEITWESKKGGTMRRVTDLLDVWFDSGAMSFAQWHYPFENKDKFKENFPADFIAEGVDQTRGWFYTLHALGTLLFDGPAYRNVVSNGLVLDAKGKKMSKSEGNTVDPFEILQEYGADATRWYMMSNSAPWDNLKFNEEGLKETQRKLFNTITNTYSFFALYANIDKFTYSGATIPVDERSEMDRWIISRQFTTIKKVDTFLEDYEPTKATREIERFADELSNWYVRRSRRRFWKEGTSLDKTSAYQTLYDCLFNLAKLSSPFAPFFSEWLYQQLHEVTGHEEESVHLSFYPTVEETSIDKSLEYRMDLARKVSSMVLRTRNKININVRQPLARIIVPAGSDEEREAFESVKDIILDEVNVKSIEYVDDDSGIVHKSAKPNFPALGKKFGKQMKQLTPLIKNLTTEQITEFEEKGSLKLLLNDKVEVELLPDYIEIIRHGLEGWTVESEDGVTIAVDTKMTPELANEGIAREFVNRVQNMRKDADFEVTDRIIIAFKSSDEIKEAIQNMQDYISVETLSEKTLAGDLDSPDYVKSWDIAGKECEIAIKRNTN